MFEIKKMSLESDKFQQAINDDVQILFEKYCAYGIQNPGAERVDAKSQYILHRNWTLACIFAPTKNRTNWMRATG